MPHILAISSPLPPKPLTTRGDLLVMGVAEAERLIAANEGKVLKSKGPAELPIWGKHHIREGGFHVAKFTHNATQTQEITGCAWEPSLLVILCTDSTDDRINWSIGFAINHGDSIEQYCLRQIMDGARINLTVSCANVFQDSSNKIIGTCTEFVSTGYTISSVKTGVISCDYAILAIA